MSVDRLINLLATVTLFEMMVLIGMSVTKAELIGLARNRWLIVKALLASYVFFPMAAIGLLQLLALPPLIATGFLIAAVCPGAPYGPVFTVLARGNLVTSVGLMVTLAGTSAFGAPLLLPLLLPLVSGDTLVQIPVGRLLGALLVVQLLPLGLGLELRRRSPEVATRLIRPATQLSSLLNLSTLIAIVINQAGTLIRLPALSYGLMALLVATGLLTGWGVGGPERGNRIATAMATSVRNVGVSLVIATGTLPGTPAVTATTAFALFQTLSLALIATVWGRRPASRRD